MAWFDYCEQRQGSSAGIQRPPERDRTRSQGPSPGGKDLTCEADWLSSILELCFVSTPHGKKSTERKVERVGNGNALVDWIYQPRAIFWLAARVRWKEEELRKKQSNLKPVDHCRTRRILRRGVRYPVADYPRTSLVDYKQLEMAFEKADASPCKRAGGG